MASVAVARPLNADVSLLGTIPNYDQHYSRSLMAKDPRMAILRPMNNPIGVAKVIFSLNAVLGVLSVGGAALYVAALSSGKIWMAFLAIFLPFSALWLLFCYGGYRGLTSEKAVLKFVFWTYVVANVFVFPVGTAISAVTVWLWRDLRRQSIDPVSA